MLERSNNHTDRRVSKNVLHTSQVSLQLPWQRKSNYAEKVRVANLVKIYDLVFCPADRGLIVTFRGDTGPALTPFPA